MKITQTSTLRLLAASTFATILGAGASQAATVAYYRFEEGAAGATIAGAGISYTQGSTALSGFGAGTYSSTVPTATVPFTGAANTRSISFGGGDLFDTNAATSVLATTAFTNFTIETYVQFNQLNNGFQTFIGRDDIGNPGQGAGPVSLFYLAKDPDGDIRAEVITSTSTNLQINDAFRITTGTWYHVALVGDSTLGSLQLFVDGISVGSTTGFNGLFNPSPNSSWTIGRGQFNGNPADRLNGFVDEVRFSDTALAPSQFLNAVPEPSAMLLGSVGALALLRRRR